MQYTIQNDSLSVIIDSLGAEMISVKKDGRERLWQNDNGKWTGHAPVLFPVCGHFAVTVNGTNYPMRAHGFAKRSPFALAARGEDFVELVLQDDEETRKVYPFAFSLFVRYRLQGSTLSVSFSVENTGEHPLAFSCGGHPSFALEHEVGEYLLEFGHAEHLVHFPHDAGGYLTGGRVDFGEQTRFALPEEYLQNDDTLIFGNVSSRAVTLSHRSGKRVASVRFADYPHLLLWRPHGARMICIEPWHNLPDPVGGDSAEFARKDGVISLPAGESKTLSFEIEYC